MIRAKNHAPVREPVPSKHARVVDAAARGAARRAGDDVTAAAAQAAGLTAAARLAFGAGSEVGIHGARRSPTADSGRKFGVAFARNLPARRSRPPDLRPALAARARSQRHAEQLSAFEHELVTAPCRLHMKGAVCDQCVAPRQLDSLGFPSVSVADGRGRYKLCPDCRKLFAIADWHFGAVLLETGKTAFQGLCKGCAGTDVQNAPLVTARPAVRQSSL